MKWSLPMVLGFGLTVAATPAVAGSCVARSPAHSVALLELFTSEGCSSCPPADRWLSSLQAAEAVAGRVVPLALHVDYWDYIGWKDPYAQPGFASRQRQLARDGGAAVYTPQFFLHGRPYRPPASAAAFEADLVALRQQAPRADIEVAVDSLSAGRLTIRFAASLRDVRDGATARLFVALYENGLVSRVTAGENRGVVLRHDYVVRRWHGPLPLPGSGVRQTLDLSVASDWQTGRLGVAVFVQDTQTRDVLQAVALPVCG